VKTGESGLEIIKMFEGFRSEPYLCPAGVATIGFGSTRGIDGNRVTLGHSAINRDEAEEMLAHDLQNVEKSVGRLIRVALTQNQFDALVSFTYNLGSGRLQSSTLRSKLNREDYEGAADQFPKWVMAGNKRLSGLVKRRFVERKLFLL
jgi:lysozyme